MFLKKSSPRIAIVHEWLAAYAGSERVTGELLKIFPEAELHCLVDFMSKEDRKKMIPAHTPRTTFVQRLPFAKKNFRNYFPLLYPAVRSMKVGSADVVITSSHAFAHSVKTRPGQLHICYCHTPMRYIWHMQDLYFRENGFHKGLVSVVPSAVAGLLRFADRRSAQRVDYFIANSQHTASKIREHYNRDAVVIYPPVEISRFRYEAQKKDYYFSSSRFVSYKKNCLLVEAFSKMPDKKLFLAGEGKFLPELRRKATPNITFLNYLPFDQYHDYLKNAKAFVFAAEEDFGITLVEAQACGTPVIAYRKGGAGEIVKQGETGMLFDEQSADSIVDAVTRFEQQTAILPAACRANAERFDTARFHREIEEFVSDRLHDHIG